MTRFSELPSFARDELAVVVGPTASGKTALALQLCEQHDGEVIGADSVQIYRHFDIGSGKPTPAEQRRARHHLIDCVDPHDHVDAAEFARRADAAIADVRARGRLPVVCGGSFLWVKALLFGLSGGAPADPDLRQRHRDIAEQHGRSALHAQLARVDPASAERLAPNDLVRVSRALEVFVLTGKTQTEWHREHAFKTVRHRFQLVGVARERDASDERIQERARNWLEQGWIDEVKQLTQRGFGDCRAMASVGYKQVKAHIDGDLAFSELELHIVRATRRFARRQRTWLRDQPVQWLTPCEAPSQT